MKAVRTRGSFEPAACGGRHQAKIATTPTSLFLQVVEKADVTMPELAAELADAAGERGRPLSARQQVFRLTM
jgi:hypothetical protein